MGKKKHSKRAQQHESNDGVLPAVGDERPTESGAKLRRKEYEAELEVLQGELVAIGLSLVSPLFVAIDKIIQMRRLDREQQEHPFAGIATTSGA